MFPTHIYINQPSLVWNMMAPEQTQPSASGASSGVGGCLEAGVVAFHTCCAITKTEQERNGKLGPGLREDGAMREGNADRWGKKQTWGA